MKKIRPLSYFQRIGSSSILDRNQKIQQLIHEDDLHFILQNIL